MRRVLSVAVVAILIAAVAPHPSQAEPNSPDAAAARPAVAAIACVNGSAGGYACKNIDLMAQLPLASMGGGSGSGGWGWTDPQTGKEYAIVARSNGTSFVDVSDPANPRYLGNLPPAGANSSWRELNVHANHAYIVSEASGHGLQVFDLTRLRSVANPPVTFTADARNTSFGSAHTITVNNTTGFAYVNGSNTCGGAPRVFNLANPKNPAFVGCVTGDGYTHDSQCVIYQGPDARYRGREICLNSNEDTLTLFDVTNKAAPVLLSRKTYAGRGYVHQGWLTENHAYFLLDDETDETRNRHNTHTYVWNMASLTNPVLVGTYVGPTQATDHNQYVKGNYSYQSNYRAGLRIVDLTNVGNPTQLTEAAYFDVHPASDARGFQGTWTNYPYFPSGNVAVFSIERGLFIVRPRTLADT